MISAAQVRAARGLLNWSQQDLASQAAIDKKTLALFERESRQPYDRTLVSIEKALGSAGVMFIASDAGEGVLLTRGTGKRVDHRIT